VVIELEFIFIFYKSKRGGDRKKEVTKKFVVLENSRLG